MVILFQMEVGRLPTTYTLVMGDSPWRVYVNHNTDHPIAYLHYSDEVCGGCGTTECFSVHVVYPARHNGIINYIKSYIHAVTYEDAARYVRLFVEERVALYEGCDWMHEPGYWL